VRILITGVTGFVGSHLAQALVRDGDVAQVWGLVRWDSDLQVVAGLGLELIEGDLKDGSSMVRVLQTACPDVVFHLAAASTVSGSWSTPADILHVNALGQVNLFEAMRSLSVEPLTVVASSAEAYGQVQPNELPVTETAPFRPVSPYGVSKAAQDLLAYQYFAGFGLPIVRLRAFNHTGPRRPDRFVCSSFARQIAEIEAGLRAPRLLVGDLSVVRDFTDVRDVTRAYWLAATRARAGDVYNLCSGRQIAIREVLDALIGMSDVEIEVEVDPARLRVADIPVLYGDHSKLTGATGWRPHAPLETTLHDLLVHWRSHLAH
jgi:GDP-4-dehydro-6-deoxy-D-mannose reductase